MKKKLQTAGIGAIALGLFIGGVVYFSGEHTNKNIVLMNPEEQQNLQITEKQTELKSIIKEKFSDLDNVEQGKEATRTTFELKEDVYEELEAYLPKNATITYCEQINNDFYLKYKVGDTMYNVSYEDDSVTKYITEENTNVMVINKDNKEYDVRALS